MSYFINENLAREAKRCRSFSDYIENSETNNYRNYINRFNNMVEQLKNEYPQNYEREKEKIDYLQEKYARKLADAINRMNKIDCYVPSMMITGAGNYPVHKARKQDEMRMNFWKENGDLFGGDNYIMSKIESILTNKTIYSNDEFALEKLNEKLQELEQRQKHMKEANAYYRKNKTLKGFKDFTDEQAESLESDIENTWYKKPYADFQLTNNNATIKSVKDRIEKLTQLKENTSEYERLDGLEIKENKELMRIQLLFEERPTSEIITILKSNGFKWAPSQKAWQRQLTENGIRSTKQIIKLLKEK